MDTSSSRADFSTAPKPPVVLQIFGCVLVALVLNFGASAITNLAFDVIGYR